MERYKQESVAVIMAGVLIVIVGFLVYSYFSSPRFDNYVIEEKQAESLNNGFPQGVEVLYDICFENGCWPNIVEYDADPYCIRFTHRDELVVRCGDINIAWKYNKGDLGECLCDY